MSGQSQLVPDGLDLSKRMILFVCLFVSFDRLELKLGNFGRFGNTRLSHLLLNAFVNGGGAILTILPSHALTMTLNYAKMQSHFAQPKKKLAKFTRSGCLDGESPGSA